MGTAEKVSRTDIIFVLDISKSMSAPVSNSSSSSDDAIISKFDVAVEFVMKTLRSLSKYDRGGLVTFSGKTQ